MSSVKEIITFLRMFINKPLVKLASCMITDFNQKFNGKLLL